MHAIPAIAFLAVALLCSLVSRVMLINAAHAVSTRWLYIVLLAPFGPLAFGFQFPEKAKSSWYFRMIAGPLVILFFLDGGTLHSLTEFGLPKGVQASAGNTDFHLPPPATPAPAKAKPSPAPAVAAAKPAKPAASPTPSAAVAASISAMASAPKVLDPAERIDANRKEFARLAEWYDNLKHERGYLRKGDTESIDAYNTQAAQYQTALQLAKSEQAAITKLTAKK